MSHHHVLHQLVHHHDHQLPCLIRHGYRLIHHCALQINPLGRHHHHHLLPCVIFYHLDCHPLINHHALRLHSLVHHYHSYRPCVLFHHLQHHLLIHYPSLSMHHLVHHYHQHGYLIHHHPNQCPLWIHHPTYQHAGVHDICWTR